MLRSVWKWDLMSGLHCTRLGSWQHARRAAAVVLPHFISTSPDRPLWEANPMDAQTVVKPHLEVAAKPLLRTFIQVCVHEGEKEGEVGRGG